MRPAGSHEHGKIQKAGWLAQEWPEAVEADLHRYYGLDFLDLFRKGSGLTWRKLLVLIDHLPPESAVKTAIRNSMPEEEVLANVGDPVNAPWSTLESLMASIIDELRQFAWMYASANSEKTIRKPEPIRRPGFSSRSSRGKRLSIEEIRRLDPRMRNVPDDQVQDTLNALTGRA